MLYSILPDKVFPTEERNEKCIGKSSHLSEEVLEETHNSNVSSENVSEFDSMADTETLNYDYGAMNGIIESLDVPLTSGSLGKQTTVGKLSFICIELSLFANVFLTGFDSTVTASIYTTIGDEFNAVSTASWITTSYLITSTAFQPLYGSFSDVLGRRICLISATFLFILGCLGCGLATHIYALDIMRAISGIGGGGLVTLATIINSDIIAPEKRGNWQAFQNLLLGFGGICGACTGGLITAVFGWRWCFLVQIPIGALSIVIGYYYVIDPENYIESSMTLSKIDLKGSITLVISLSLQLLYLTIGGNEIGWFDNTALLLILISVFMLILFISTEIATNALPILPPELLQNSFSMIILSIGVLVGFASYAYLFLLPVLFQIVLGDSISMAGLRLAFPSIFTPIGGLITGYFMNKSPDTLFALVCFGCICMFIGNYLSLLIHKNLNPWLLALYLIPANIGQGMIFPSSLFCFIYFFDKEKQAIATSTAYLFRSIGSVWGVACSASIVKHYLKIYAVRKLKEIPGMDEEKIMSVLKSVSQDISKIGFLDPIVSEIINFAYASSIRKALEFSCFCCGLCLILCVIKVIFKVNGPIRKMKSMD
ncbi:VBA2 [Brettanomyces bruxellensis]|uniref:DEBR0S3_14906g1_1 n=1 Tax=Dekkera bruxellensis TaxID=5007 RepID=A0A7D9CYW1_DEKBR|nr:VBA2 [Brettanomyces bruxellensis]